MADHTARLSLDRQSPSHTNAKEAGSKPSYVLALTELSDYPIYLGCLTVFSQLFHIGECRASVLLDALILWYN